MIHVTFCYHITKGDRETENPLYNNLVSRQRIAPPLNTVILKVTLLVPEAWEKPEPNHSTMPTSRCTSRGKASHSWKWAWLFQTPESSLMSDFFFTLKFPCGSFRKCFLTQGLLCKLGPSSDYSKMHLGPLLDF